MGISQTASRTAGWLTDEELRQLDCIFNPASVAIIGATDSSDRVGFNCLEAILMGGFKGKIYPIHPRHKELLGLKVYAHLEEVESPIDLAIIALNQYATVEMLETCGRLGIAGAIAVAGGYKEMGAEGEELERRLVAISRRYGIKVIGPNTLGLANTHANLNATFYPLGLAKKGNLSIISQSGGVGRSIVEKATDEGLAISKWIGVGNRACLEFADFLQYLDYDPTTKVIGVFLEATEDARRLVQVAGEVAQHKPVVIFKAGETEIAQQSALTHTGSMATSHKVYTDIFQQFGLISVGSVAELVAACKALLIGQVPAGPRVGVMTHTAGPSIIVVDELAKRGCVLSSLGAQTVERVRTLIGPNVPVILKNPLDAAAFGYQPEQYGQVAEVFMADPNVDLLLAMHALHKNWRFPAPEIIRAKQRYGKPTVTCYIANVEGAREHMEMMHREGIPLYITAEEAAWGAAWLVNYARRKGRREKR
ncbi:MAG: CoA-binding protein [Chloroflexi bacterium]|nr:CoA-binding protein [Chloroflexota bacterium]